ncbi:ABC transporter permease [Porifericola rhodea]|uniref:ABC transporter permease n=1 Tax=Porifericola rhodea TaxID=930972 RepID=UPI0026662E27|nr:ABC transporter permease [Porifericola rhodea]WKN32639.1 ABC transporter permease [Porifericola rhodea]
MLRSYFKIALRNLWKHKTQSIVSIFGLSLGIARAIVIFLIVNYELSFDNFHSKADQTYRIVTDFEHSGSNFGSAGVPRPLPESLAQRFGDDLEAIIPLEIYNAHRRVQIDDKVHFVDGVVAYTVTTFKYLTSYVLAHNPSRLLFGSCLAAKFCLSNRHWPFCFCNLFDVNTAFSINYSRVPLI